MVRFGNQLHVAVFDPVMHHFDKMPGAVFADPVAARGTVFDFGGNALKNVLDVGPGGRRAARHDGGPLPGASFPTRDAHPHK